ncbi:hypothetical protein [Verrucosispora sp. FIM060022]|uniref:hypothetical protein n=1 Tax=Verrucosispora sp. FIM060022 TaxID=1479020 RepID=UPI000F862865|nr:hypothetical protein [Verrucosispora sp. FIM060022]RUL93807.1 hypothetical protein EG812_08990 [Verrucosispora sp. FIM060022]
MSRVAVVTGASSEIGAGTVADCIAWYATRPPHVNVDRLVVRSLVQAAHIVQRVSGTGAGDRSPAGA